MGLLSLVFATIIACSLAAEGPNTLFCENGADWGTTVETAADATCMFGDRQTPIDLQEDFTSNPVPLPHAFATNITGCTVSSMRFKNLGTVVQYEWDAGCEEGLGTTVSALSSNHLHLHVTNLLYKEGAVCPSDELLASEGPLGHLLNRTTITPVQFHFHTPSEHTMNGIQCEMEMHIVCVISGEAGGTHLSVLGVMFNCPETEGGVPVRAANPVLNQLVANIPASTVIPTNVTTGDGTPMTPTFELNLADLLPEERSYFTYTGSLTTPPCSEGLLWHVFSTPVSASLAQITQFQNAFGENDGCTPKSAGNFREIMPLNGRTLAKFDAADPHCPTTLTEAKSG